MKPKVSIIVPIYNMERYLKRCLESLLSQSLDDIEVIAVNDGSTDASAEILHEFAARDGRLVVIHKPNGGVSSARNAGMAAARGEYLGFVDPDDWVDADMYKAMYELAVHRRADIVMCGYVREFGTHSKEKKFDLPEISTFRDQEIITSIMRRLVGPLNEEIAKPDFLDAWGTVWSKIYRAGMVKEQAVLFTDLSEVGTNEDSLFNIHACYYAKTFVFLNRPYYHYWRENTASVTSGYKPDLLRQWSTLYSLIESFLDEKKLHPDFYRALDNRKCLNTLGLGLNTISPDNQAILPEKLKKLNAILNDSQIQRSFRQLETERMPFVWRAFYFCAKGRFVIGFYFMLVAIDRLRKMIR
ncbi:glycosyltransferase family 2 protein [Ferviditalea candida]|uniref:Glycosyltransferase n=1 Tax=Ferviditalea candida TaxID=3108399 RepID=A0ABU5ZE50_9BACL|nr:glycosyltransferase [Paenibacillaceae bacterium T2]